MLVKNKRWKDKYKKINKRLGAFIVFLCKLRIHDNFVNSQKLIYLCHRKWTVNLWEN